MLLLQNVDVYDEDDEDDETDECDDDQDDSEDDDYDSDDPGVVYRSGGGNGIDIEAGGGRGPQCSHKLQRCTWHSANAAGSTLIL